MVDRGILCLIGVVYCTTDHLRQGFVLARKIQSEVLVNSFGVVISSN